MTDFGNIGLNEVAIGIPVPAYWALLMQRTVGQRTAEKLLPYGLMPKADEALQMGLVDALVPADRLTAAAEETMQQMLKVFDGGRQATKGHLRKAFSKEWEAFCEGEAADGWRLVSHPQTVLAMEGILQKLSKGKKDA